MIGMGRRVVTSVQTFVDAPGMIKQIRIVVKGLVIVMVMTIGVIRTIMVVTGPERVRGQRPPAHTALQA